MLAVAKIQLFLEIQPKLHFLMCFGGVLIITKIYCATNRSSILTCDCMIPLCAFCLTP